MIDFDGLARHPALEVFVGATPVSTGKAEVFSDKRLLAQGKPDPRTTKMS